MKSPLHSLFLVAAGSAIIFPIDLVGDDSIRSWRSTGGKTIQGELVEVRDGKAIIRPAVKLIEAPLDKLSQTDQNFVRDWQKEREKELEARKEADQLLARSRPLGKMLIGRTVIGKGQGDRETRDRKPGPPEICAPLFFQR